MLFGYLILFGIDLVILSRLFLLSYSFNWEDRCTCVHSVSNTEDHIPSHFQHLKFCQKFSAVWVIFWTLFSIFGNVVKHGLSCLMYYIIVTTIVVCYSFKDVRAQLWHIFNLTSRICMGYPFHLGDTLWSALKSLETYYICNCLAHKLGLVLSKWKVYCTCLDLWLSSWYATSLKRPGMWLHWMNVCTRNCPKKAEKSCIVFFK